MTDCMIIGFNDFDFDDYVETLAVLGSDAISYRDANLSFVTHQGKRLRALDFINLHAGMQGQNGNALNNSDFLWPVITYLGTFLDRKGFSFDYVRLFQQDKEKLRQALESGQVMSVAITTTVYVTPQPIIEIVDFVRTHGPNTKIILGGPYFADQPKTLDNESLNDLLTHIGADYYVFGAEGEAALVKLLTAIKTGTSPQDIESIAYRKDDRFVVNLILAEGNSLEDNMVDYSLFPKEDIGEFVTVRTAKSCPFACAFCGFPERAGKYKYLALDYVEKELDAIRAIGGVSTITFIDDTFNVPKARFKDILRLMIDKNYGFRWNSYLRSDHVDNEALELMAQSGCEGVFLGVESGSERILKNMTKTSRPHHYEQVIAKCRELGIITYASIIIGFPGEDQSSVQESIDFLERAKPDFFRAQVWYADPITPVYRDGQKYGLSGQAFQWKHDTMEASTAAYYVEKMFLTVFGSTWLPQNGFEPWSMYYLQRKGLSLAKITAFLRQFNDAIKQKLLDKEREEIDADTCAKLVSSITMPEGLPASTLVYSADQLAPAISQWASYIRGATAPKAELEVATAVSAGKYLSAKLNLPALDEAGLLELIERGTNLRDEYAHALQLVLDQRSASISVWPVPPLAVKVPGLCAPSHQSAVSQVLHQAGVYLLCTKEAREEYALGNPQIACIWLITEQDIDKIQIASLDRLRAYYGPTQSFVVFSRGEVDWQVLLFGDAAAWDHSAWSHFVQTFSRLGGALAAVPKEAQKAAIPAFNF